MQDDHPTNPEADRRIANAKRIHATTLDLRALGLYTVPTEIKGLTTLQSLYLSYNNLTTLPDWMRELTALQSLDLSGNNLTTLPDWMRELTALQSLNLGGDPFRSNNLTTLPDWMRELTALQSLYLSYNNLTTLPDWMRELTALQSLDLSYNDLTTLPDWMRELTQLQWLNIATNPITEPPPQLLGRALKEWNLSVDMDSLRAYWRQQVEQGRERFYEAKLLIIGEGGAGKTSLARKLKNPHAHLPQPDESTPGIEKTRWMFPLFDNEKQYTAHIWDFGGQEIYFATHQFFLTKRSLYVLLADTRHQHTDFYTWLKLQETFGGDSPVLLIKNRNRKHGNVYNIHNLPQLHARFPNLHKTVLEVDLQEVPNTPRWRRLVQELQHQLHHLPHIGTERPAGWVRVREHLQNESRDTITLDQFLAICREAGVQRRSDGLQLSDYLHHIGDILHYQDDEALHDFVILNPTWALDAVYRVLDNRAIDKKRGRFNFADIKRLWHEAKYAPYRHELLHLMQEFKLCYPLPHQRQTYIAPQLLPKDAPAYQWEEQDNLHLRWHYPVFMPFGILSRAIVDLHQQIEMGARKQQIVWQTGVVLRDDFARAELIELRGEDQIRIRIAGRNKRDLLMQIVRSLDGLHQAFPKLRYDKLIVCPCAGCSAAEVNARHFYPLEQLRNYAADRIPHIRCGKHPRHEVSVAQLMSDAVMDDPILHDRDPFEPRRPVWVEDPAPPPAPEPTIPDPSPPPAPQPAQQRLSLLARVGEMARFIGEKWDGVQNHVFGAVIVLFVSLFVIEQFFDIPFVQTIIAWLQAQIADEG